MGRVGAGWSGESWAGPIQELELCQESELALFP
jgi:hypothetical protein